MASQLELPWQPKSRDSEYRAGLTVFVGVVHVVFNKVALVGEKVLVTATV